MPLMYRKAMDIQFRSWWLWFMGAAFVGGCVSGSGVSTVSRSSQSPFSAAPAEITVLELEAFDLKQASVREEKGAGGGKVVLFDYISGSAVTNVAMKSGKYGVTAYAVAPGTKHDAFYIFVGPDLKERVWPKDILKVSPTRTFLITIEKDEPVRIEIAPGEIDIMVDRLEIRRVK